MVNLILSNSNGSEKLIPFPESLCEVLFDNKIAFDICREDIDIWVSREVEQDTFLSNSPYFLYLISRAISAFLDIDLQTFLDIDVSDILDRDYNLDLSSLEKFNNRYSKKLDLDSLEVNLMQLYSMILTLINSYEFEFRNGENHTFTYNGKVWEIPYLIKSSILGSSTFSKFSVSQAVEILQIKKILSESSKKGDSLRDERFTFLLKTIATTIRLKGEIFPLEEYEIRNLIEDRIVEFCKIDCKTAYDILFFLITTSSI